MKTIIKKPERNDRIVFTDEYTLTLKTFIDVPIQYKAIVYINGRSFYRLDPCVKLNFARKFGKENIGKTVRIAYILWNSFECVTFDYKNLEKHDENEKSILLSSNGTLIFEIINYPRMIAVFQGKESISEGDIKEKVSQVISNEVSDVIVSEMRDAEKDGSFENLSARVYRKICGDNLFDSIGVRLFSIFIENAETVPKEKEEA